MNLARRTQGMTPETFLDWANARNERFEFVGSQPVATTGGTRNHSLMTPNINVAPRNRPHGTACGSLGPSSGRIDRIGRPREYQAVPSILRYVIVELTSAAITVHARDRGGVPWTTTTLTGGDVLAMPETGVDIPIDEFYEDTGLIGTAQT